MLSAISFNLDQCKILLSDNGLRCQLTHSCISRVSLMVGSLGL